MALTVQDLIDIGDVLDKRLDAKLESIHRQLDEHGKTIYGNGNPGLKTMVDRHEQFVSSLRADNAEVRSEKNARGISRRAIIVSVILSGASLITTIAIASGVFK